MKTDIERALAEGLYQSLWGDYRPDDWPDNLSEEPEEWFDSPLALAAAVLATEPMQAIARVVEAADKWADAYGARWDAMMGNGIEDPRIEADATLALYAAIAALEEAS